MSESVRPHQSRFEAYAPPNATTPPPAPSPAPPPLSDAEHAALVSLVLRVWRWRATRPLLLGLSAYLAGTHGRLDLLPALFGAPTATVSAQERTALHQADSDHTNALVQLRAFADSSRVDRAALHRHRARIDAEPAVQRRGIEQTREITGVIGCTMLPATTRLALRLPCARLQAGEPWPLDSGRGGLP